MSVFVNQVPGREIRAGIETALQGLSTLVMPSLLYVGILGPLAGNPGLWGTFLAITLVPILRLVWGGSSCIITAPRTASTATYVAMVLQLGMASSAGSNAAKRALLDATQLRNGLAAASIMYLLASLLVAFSGYIRLGRVFKMIPTPVTTGISNGTALLLLSLALGKVREGRLMAAGIAFAMVIAYATWAWFQTKSPLAKGVPSILLSLVAGGIVTLLLVPIQVGQPSEGWAGILEGTPWTSVILWDSLGISRLGTLLMLGIPGAITLALVMVLETFTTASTMEIRFGVRCDADRELVALGTSNIIGALTGGVPCTGSTVYSVASWLSGGRGRIAAWACCACGGLAIAFFDRWISEMPAGLGAGLLLLQASMLVNPAFFEMLWTIARTGRWQRPATQDLGFWISVLISLVGYFGNLIWACFAGVGLSCLAVLRRVSENLTAHWLYLDTLRSRRIRTQAESNALTHLARDVGVLRLSGHLFFGNSARIMQLAEELDEGCACAVIDISLVQDADPSGLDAIAWLLRALRQRGVRVVLSGLDKTRVGSLRTTLGYIPAAEQAVDLDRGLEHCEDWILRNSTALPLAQASLPIEANSLLQGLTNDEVTAVLMVADVREVAQGDALFRKDERSDGVWMLQSGQVSILAGIGAQATRLATFGPGQFIGEMGFIDGNTRSATATADAPVRAVLLDNQALAALVRDHSNAALQITRNIARELSHRVRSTSAVLAQEADGPHSVWANSALSLASKTNA